MGVSGIAAELELNVNSCFKLLKTLVAEGMLHFDEQRKTYAVSAGVIELARGAYRLPLRHARRIPLSQIVWERSLACYCGPRAIAG